MTKAERFTSFDHDCMAEALALARARLGRVAPNPAVGCVIAARGRVLAAAATGPGGRPHAEEAALAAFDIASPPVAPSEWSVYVTLEPCASRTSPHDRACAERLVQWRPGRVVIACLDPHFDGEDGTRPSLARLSAAGVTVATGLCAAEARALNIGFFTRLATGRPFAAIDAARARYDAEFDLEAGESCQDALDRLGRRGLTRVHVMPGSPLADRLRACGLADFAD